MQIKPYGTWESNIQPEQLATSGVSFFDTVVDGEYVYNVESRPQEKGRYVLVRYAPDGSKLDITPEPFGVRTRVHEYGGRAFTVADGVIYFVNFKDQNLYKMRIGETPQQLTTTGIRFAELTMTKHGLVAVGEEHATSKDQEAENFIALINPHTGATQKLVTGSDFYAFPTVNATQDRLAWICWNHPNMPWDRNQLWAADFKDGKVTNHKQILAESVHQAFFQPGWDAANNLCFVTDYNNWWNLNYWSANMDMVFPIYNSQHDFGKALWNLGINTWGFVNKDTILASYIDAGNIKLILLNSNGKNSQAKPLDLPYTCIDRIKVAGENVYFIGGSATLAPALIKLNVLTGEYKQLSDTTPLPLLTNEISVGQHIEFPTSSRQGKAYAYFYPPTSANFTAPEGSKPPLIIFVHGGPTSSAYGGFMLEKQFWTNRGFAIVDVNYGGSTGYGREYRKSLQRDAENKPGYWGQIDIQDCVAAVKYLTAQGLIDPNKVVTRGRSAGGYTTLALLAFTDICKAGTSYYGVSDMLALAADTHKFESRYLDQLVGALPAFRQTYLDRSPIEHLEKFSAPLLVLQGDEDKVVPVSQAESMVKKLQKLGVRVEYKLYNGEQHGFKKSETIVDALQRELAFYLSVFYPELEQKKTLTASKRLAIS